MPVCLLSWRRWSRPMSCYSTPAIPDSASQCLPACLSSETLVAQHHIVVYCLYILHCSAYDYEEGGAREQLLAKSGVQRVSKGEGLWLLVVWAARRLTPALIGEAYECTSA